MAKEKIPQNLNWISLVLIIVFLIYSQIFFGFFQQDEWASFAINSLLLENNFLDYLKEIFNPTIGHYQPFNNLVLSQLYSILGLNYYAYASISILLHLINVLLVFILSFRIFKSILLSLLCSLLFGVSASVFQATNWVLADLGVHLSTLFALLSIIFTINYAETLERNNLVSSIIFLFSSLLFKEITIGLFLLLPLTFFIFSKKEKKIKNIALIFAFLGFSYIIIRAGMYLLPSAYYLEESVAKSQTLPNLFYNMSTFPIKGFVQSLVPINLLLAFGYFISNIFPTDLVGNLNTTQRDIVVQKWFLEIISFSLFIITTLIVLKFKNKFKNRILQYKKALLFGALLILLNTSIFALAPERSGKISIIDSRNLYFINIGTVIITSSIIAAFFKNTIYKVIVFFLIILINIAILNQNLNSTNQNSIVRKEILEEINQIHPGISNKTVFFTQSDTSYYGLPEEEKILPFQSGFGQTLALNYYSKGYLPSEFLKDRFLWGITEQGYKEVGDFGFGYFRNLELLKKIVNQYNIPKESVIGYSWDSESNNLEDISDEIRKRL